MKQECIYCLLIFKIENKMCIINSKSNVWNLKEMKKGKILEEVCSVEHTYPHKGIMFN